MTKFFQSTVLHTR